MSMQHNGLAKLIEEFGEAQQILGKLIQYPELQMTRDATHPDGSCLLDRLEEEIADVQAAIAFVDKKLNLNTTRINQRRHMKLTRFFEWDKE